MSQITVMTGPERRRRWRPEDKVRILAEAFSPGACVDQVARRHDVSRGLIYTWRRKLRRELPQPAPSALLGPGFAEAVLTEEPGGAPSPLVAIVVELPGSGRVSIAASASPALASAVLMALR
jgi:transposase